MAVDSYVVESLFASDLAFLQDLYRRINQDGHTHAAVTCPSCRALLEPSLPLEVDRLRARFGSWYELFPRSWGGIKGVEEQVPALAEMGFDVVYMTPIHPIGRKNRKGRNNTLTAGPDDPGSPYAVGAIEGGHDAVHPDIGTVEDVRSLCRTAADHGMDVCMDFAINASAIT